MKGSEIRAAYLDFFERNGHRRVPSSSLLPEGDPTLMFVNAGMVPFKRVFVGEETRDYTRATSAQKCLRVSGKHNDLEEVGRTPRHHTFFEMLGNFSFGDYFKKEAIGLAWEFLTGVLKLEPERLVVSVLRGDDEAAEIWRRDAGLPESKIFALAEKENFWSMGETGPCGPCSEIHLVGSDGCGRPSCDPACECGRYLEFWNLVFMQFEQAADGTRTPLPRPSIDTGFGLDRAASILQGVETNYDTDLFAPMIARAAEITGRPYHRDPEHDVSLRVLADHARACTFMIGDGVLPSNEGRGYVLRRVLRRAARHGVLLGTEEPFFYEVAGTVVDEMSPAYPELAARKASIQATIKREEERFLKTLSHGLELLDAEIAAARRDRRTRLAGQVVFKLYDTFGFPTDLTADILRTNELTYDADEFDACMAEQKKKGQEAWKGSGQSATAEVYNAVLARMRSTFVGYDALDARVPIEVLIREGVEVESASEGDRVEIVTAQTPFYAESGGQVGDRGTIETEGGRVAIEDVQKPIDGVITHIGTIVAGEIRAGDMATLRVDAETRAATVRNHSGTHLFHWALRDVLGPQVQQAGSLVAPDRLRFDFSHDEPLTPAQIEAIEDRVNDLILRNLEGRTVEKPYDEAIESGAVAIFEEKYSDVVRVVSFGDISIELCGGTHAKRTGDIGSFRITGQSAVGAGVRRIEAQTGRGALDFARRESEQLQRAAALLRTSPADLPDRIQRGLERERELQKELEKTRAEMRRGGSADPMQQLREVGGVRLIATEIADANPKELRGLVDELKQKLGSGIVLIASRQGGKAALAMGVTKDLTTRFAAGRLIGEISEAVGGRGGGRPDFAQAGGPETEGIEAAIARLVELIESAERGS